MIVYIVFGTDGYNGEQIEGIFAKESSAQGWVIKNILYCKYSDNTPKHVLEEEALEYITAHEVVE